MTTTQDDFFIPDQAIQSNQIEDSSDFFIPDEKPTNAISGSEFRRHAARTGARVAEQTLGMPGSLTKNIPQFAIGKLYEMFTGKAPEKEDLEKIQKATSYLGGLSQYITPESIKSTHEKVTGEYLKPQNEGEKKFDEVVEDSTNILVPLLVSGGYSNILGTLGRTGAVVAFGHAAKEGTKALGGDEGWQEKAKSIAMFLASMFKPYEAEKTGAKLYEKREASLPVDVTGDARKLEASMTNLQSKMKRGTLAPSEKAIVDETQSILNKIDNGKMSYQEAAAAKRSINEKSQAFLYTTPDKLAKARAKKLYSSINKDLEQFIDTSKNTHPEFYQAHKQANEVFSAIQESKKVSSFIKDNAKYITAAGVSTKLTGLLTLPQTAGMAVGGFSLLKSSELAWRMLKSPVLRKMYLKTMSTAAAQNLPATINNLRKLQKDAEKYEPEIFSLIEE